MKKLLCLTLILSAFLVTASAPVVKKEVMTGFVAIIAPVENQTLVLFTVRFKPTPKTCWDCAPVGACGTPPYCCKAVPCPI